MSINFKEVPSACFVLEESKLRRNLEIMKRVQDASGVNIILALKGFAMYSTFGLIKQYLHGTTASSLHEARLGFEEFGDEVHAYSPAYFEDEFDELMRYCNHITFNSPAQWNRFKSKIQEGEKKISCAIRINPEYSEVETDLYNPCAIGTRLGVTADQLGDTLPEGIEGLHFHTLCESDSYALERTLKEVEAKFSHLLRQAKWLNMGGGHLMTREGYDIEHLIGLIKYMREKYNINIIMEPGSAVAWDTGYLIATVQDIIESKSVHAAILDVSIAAHMPDCIEMPYKPKILGAEDARAGHPAYRIGGTTCLAGDYVGDYYFEKSLQPGDRLVFNDMMHYTMVKTTTFNGVRHPSIGIWHEDDTFELVKTFGYESYKHKLS
ncbi:carboxynorspermidine decarboxylase [Catalinimonas niigatensis]|uniref:carboxynorspermidine decarboxylase n=1 Tax=Catalinimonas niigatensis TaxID=1397264 RepID=UPI0026671DAC|nr:carboxynorspermidine decarboxylase [Catalinimonas niigatensis]WPP50007.1 carboxynorspermidine decarboxylase [Catalinimonas niigatensis]